jgi:hypothetical protein
MRSLTTWALVAALGLISLAAAVDALRGGAPPSKTAPLRAQVSQPRQPCPQAVAAMFRGEGGTMPCAPAAQRRFGI